LLLQGAIVLFGAGKLLFRGRKRLFRIAILYLKARKLLLRRRKRYLGGRKLLVRGRKRLLKGANWCSEEQIGAQRSKLVFRGAILFFGTIKLLFLKAKSPQKESALEQKE